MFAFSQIIASGAKVSEITDQMDKENHQEPQQASIDNDMDMLAFSSTLPGNENEPVEVVTDTKLRD